MWSYDGTYVTNERGKVIEVNGKQDGEGRHLDGVAKDNGFYQHWDVVYGDEWKGEPAKGDMNEDFGLYVERPFYIVSKLASHRYIDIIDNRNMVIKTRNSMKTQEWYFH